jgi:hypothetical protein
MLAKPAPKAAGFNKTADCWLASFSRKPRPEQLVAHIGSQGVDGKEHGGVDHVT